MKNDIIIKIKKVGNGYIYTHEAILKSLSIGSPEQCTQSVYVDFKEMIQNILDDIVFEVEGGNTDSKEDFHGRIEIKYDKS
ncbi:hypothetical protein ES703_61303 [subsurface metagenome]